ncbi:hypothetical protein B0T14DRAFT_529058 [Immersiella caudata]|uniref:Cellobiose dehydrogenase-like cytochrome domain-containing protein n=1 Tax=Immersiella caudata TaxID=314043 RepID=A0AA39WAR4_9PEZI|nr:hypothetical protein B0T14DRAFT_529058 [Immersiella caudata]
MSRCGPTCIVSGSTAPLASSERHPSWALVSKILPLSFDKRPTELSQALAQSDSVKVMDPETGLNWASFTHDRGVTIRVAVPEGVAETVEFDVAFQIIAPAHLGWVGLAWGGSMTYNPLTVSWPNGQSVTVSSRMALQVPLINAIAPLKLTTLQLAVASARRRSTTWPRTRFSRRERMSTPHTGR